MQNRSQRLRLTVGPETVRMLELGHPWVIADRYTARWPKFEVGELAELTSEQGRPLGTALLDPGARIVARLLSRAPLKLDRDWLVKRMQQGNQARQWLELGDTTAWRLINGEGDNLPGLTIDRYGEYLLLQYYSPSWEPYLDALCEAARQVYQPLGIYGKFRPQETRRLAGQQGSQGRLLWGKPAPDDYCVREQGLCYRVDLVRDLHSGLFLDQRDNRQRFRRLAAGAKVLNLFAYTGAFSVTAAAGGALSVTSVDAAGRYLAWATENFRSNGIDPSPHRFLTEDCFQALEQFAETGESFDLIFIDPPSFSTTRKSRFTTSGGTAELVRRALRLLPAGGLLVTSSNLAKMSFSDYLKELRRGANDARRTLQILEVAGQGGDFPFTASFPEGCYLKYVVSVVQDHIGIE